MKHLKRNQLRAGVLLTYATIAANAVIQLVYTPVMLRLLGQNEYGLYTLVGSVVSYLSLCSLGMTGSYLRFYARYKEEGNANKIGSLNGCFLVLNILAALLAVILGVVMVQKAELIFGSGLTQEELRKASILMIILVANIALTFPNSVFDSILISEECFGYQRGLKLAAVVANPFISLPLLLAGYDSIALVCVTTGLTLASLAVNIYYCIRKLRVTISFRGIESDLVKRIGVFSFFIFLNMVIDQVNWNVDKLLLGRYWGTSVVAVYGVASQLNALYNQCSSAVSSVFSPRINQLFAQNTEDNRKKINELFIQVGRIQFMILMLLLGGIVFFGRYFIWVWAGEGYKDAYEVVLLLIIPSTIPLIQNLGIEIQRAQNKHHVRSVVYFAVMLLNITLSIPLSKAYGAIGAAAGTAVSMILGNGIFMNWYYQKCLDVNVTEFWREILKLVPALIPSVLFGGYCMIGVEITDMRRFCILVLVYAIIYAASIWVYVQKKKGESRRRSDELR